MLRARHILWLGFIAAAATWWTSAVHAQSPVTPANDDASIESRLRRLATQFPADDASTQTASDRDVADAGVKPTSPATKKTTDTSASNSPGETSADASPAAGDSGDTADQRMPFVGPHADFENRPLGAGVAGRVSDAGQTAAYASTPQVSGDKVAASTSNVGFGWIMQTLTALGVVIGLIFLLRAAANRFKRPSIGTTNNAVVEVLSRIAVGQRHHVMLMRLGQRVLVIGESAAGMQTLATIDDPEEIAELLQAIEASKPQSLTRNFSEMLHSMHGDYKDEPGDTAEIHTDTARDQVSRVVGRIRALGGRGGRP